MDEQTETHEAEAASPARSREAEIVQKWVGDCVNNTPIARDTEGYNHLVTSALPELLRRLSAA